MTILHGGCAHFLQCLVHDGPGVVKKYICLCLLVLLIACVFIDPVIDHVVVAHVINNITHLLFLGVVLVVVIAAAGGAAEAEAEAPLILCYVSCVYGWLLCVRECLVFFLLRSTVSVEDQMGMNFLFQTRM